MEREEEKLGIGEGRRSLDETSAPCTYMKKQKYLEKNFWLCIFLSYLKYFFLLCGGTVGSSGEGEGDGVGRTALLL